MSGFYEMISGKSLVEAPVVFNPMTAKLAEARAFPHSILAAVLSDMCSALQRQT
jgi:hypothetical protein